MARSNPISVQRLVEIKGQVRAELLPKLTADTARSELARVLAEDRARGNYGAAATPYRQYVDGTEGAPLDGVRPGGLIRFTFQRVAEVIDWIYRELVEMSPVGPEAYGHFRDTNWLFINGARAPIPEPGSPVQIPPGAEVVMANLRAYARKIEQGRSMQAPDGVYELAARAARRQFPSADIEFNYRGFSGATPISGKNANRADMRYPCIILRAAA